MISLICGICKKKKKIQMNLFTQKKQTHRHRRLIVTKGEMKGRNKLEIWGLKYTYYHIENR